MTQAQMHDFLKKELRERKVELDLYEHTGSHYSVSVAYAKVKQTERILNRLFPE